MELAHMPHSNRARSLAYFSPRHGRSTQTLMCRFVFQSN